MWCAGARVFVVYFDVFVSIESGAVYVRNKERGYGLKKKIESRAVYVRNRRGVVYVRNRKRGSVSKKWNPVLCI